MPLRANPHGGVTGAEVPIIVITVEGVSKRYGQHLAVDDISFQVDDGEIVGFLGPNGAGKSTTMNIITGYLSATAGKVTVDGFDVLENPDQVKRAWGTCPSCRRSTST